MSLQVEGYSVTVLRWKGSDVSHVSDFLMCRAFDFRDPVRLFEFSHCI